jgi:hypothetical protein
MMRELDKHQIAGWIAVERATAITCFWAFWGIIENFHEGWHYESLLSNLGLMFVQYLSPMLILVGVTLTSIFWPRVGAGLHGILALGVAWFFGALTNPVTLFLMVPLIGLGALYWFGHPQPRRVAASLAIGLPILILTISGIEPVLRVSQRLDDGNLQARLVHGIGVDVIWAPDGPGWPRQGADWVEAQQVCAYLSPDGRAELLGKAASGIEAWRYDDATGLTQLPDGPRWSDASGWDYPHYFLTIQTGDVNGDGRAELLGRGISGIEAWRYDDAAGWTQLPDGPAWSDASGWDAAQYVLTIQTGDIDGDERAELLGRDASGIEAWRYDDATGWTQLPDGPAWSYASGWDDHQNYRTIQTGDINGDGQAELLARDINKIQIWRYDGLAAWTHLPDGPAWSDASGWDALQYYETIQTGDISGDGRAEAPVGRSSTVLRRVPIHPL